MQSKAKNVYDYLAALTDDQRTEIGKVRRVILDNLPAGYVERMEYGMIGYAVPLEIYPDTYNGQPLGVAALAAQKKYNSVYLMGVYGDKATERWFLSEYKKSRKRLDMGKSCVRFRRADDLPLDLIGKTIARISVADFVAMAKAARDGRR